MKKLIILTILSSFLMANVDIKIFPKPKESENRWVINLPVQDNEEDYKVELLFGKELELDCNNYLLAGDVKVEPKNLDGWGYDYYIFSGDGVLGGTRMMCPPNEAKKKKFVAFNKNLFLRYNSKIPIVVYSPKDIVLKYKIFKVIKSSSAKAL